MVEVDRRQQHHVIWRLGKTAFQFFKSLTVVQIVRGIEFPLRRMDPLEAVIVDIERVVQLLANHAVPLFLIHGSRFLLFVHFYSMTVKVKTAARFQSP